jgi:hypothetical protein
MASNTQVFIRNSEILSTEMDGEVVMMDVDQGFYFSLSSGVGATIWSLLENPVSTAQIIAGVCNEYNTTPDECRTDIEGFVVQLHEKQLISLTPAP